MARDSNPRYGFIYARFNWEKRRVKKGVKASRLGLGATMTDEKREEL